MFVITITLHVRFTLSCISLPSSAKQHRKIKRIQGILKEGKRVAANLSFYFLISASLVVIKYRLQVYRAGKSCNNEKLHVEVPFSLLLTS